MGVITGTSCHVGGLGESNHPHVEKTPVFSSKTGEKKTLSFCWKPGLPICFCILIYISSQIILNPRRWADVVYRIGGCGMSQKAAL